jgi:RNA polymerase sigma-70 factor (ECF subfamily)
MNEFFVEQMRRVYEEHRQELFTYALALTRDRAAAEDAIHNAFARLLRRGTAPADLRPYVFRCVRNAAIDGQRQGRRHEDGIFALASDADALAPADSGIAEEVERLLAELSADEREAIVLKVVDALTLQEVADVRGVSVNTAASWYRRGLEKLRVLWEEKIT